jgi:hypothetical protein
MSTDALNQLREMLRASVTHAEGELTDEAMTLLAAEAKARVWLFVGAVPELTELGATVRSRDQGRVTWARELLGSILPGFERRDRIAQGLLGLLDDEIRTYRETRKRREQRSPP